MEGWIYSCYVFQTKGNFHQAKKLLMQVEIFDKYVYQGGMKSCFHAASFLFGPEIFERAYSMVVFL